MAGSSTARILIVTDAQDDEALLDVLAAGLADLMAGYSGQPAPRGGTTRILELVGPATPRPAGTTLTERQVEVLRPMAQGLSNKEIARELGVSPATVKTHVAQLIGVLGATNRTDAAIKARERGLI